MVLQRDRQLAIWGWADAGEEVAVSFAGQQVPGCRRLLASTNGEGGSGGGPDDQADFEHRGGDEG